ncbi:hypothetical protein BaRGS_00008692 [Batillaria attramentaria]|uniref:Uncharacterized protein n=1 Tax=Batillaria attramentaria TaxID=370345 RepID=A0ABD0LLE6_9CAEN
MIVTWAPIGWLSPLQINPRNQYFQLIQSLRWPISTSRGRLFAPRRSIVSLISLDVFLSHLQGSKRAPSLGTSAFMGTDYHSDSGIGTGPNAWRKYSLPQDQQTVEQRPQ